MGVILVNSLSANAQFHSVSDAEAALAELVECFKLILPAIRGKVITLVADDSIYSRCLVRGNASLSECIGSMSNRDAVLNWYLYTKNKAVSASSELGDFSIAANGDSISGSVSKSFEDAGRLVGFGGSVVCEASEVEISGVDLRRKVASSFCRIRLLIGLPIFEPNPKHRAKPYVRSGGEHVAPMPLSDADSWICLMLSVIVGDDRFGMFDGDYYRFVRTHPDRDVFHGFLVGVGDVPESARKKAADAWKSYEEGA